MLLNESIFDESLEDDLSDIEQKLSDISQDIENIKSEVSNSGLDYTQYYSTDYKVPIRWKDGLLPYDEKEFTNQILIPRRVGEFRCLCNLNDEDEITEDILNNNIQSFNCVAVNNGIGSSELMCNLLGKDYLGYGQHNDEPFIKNLYK